MLENKEGRKLFECHCAGEGVEVEWHDEKDMCNFYYWHLWNAGQRGRKLQTLYDRLKACWNILTKGEYMTFDIVLEKAEAEALGEELLKYKDEK
jgi:hypothetical protein